MNIVKEYLKEICHFFNRNLDVKHFKTTNYTMIGCYLYQSVGESQHSVNISVCKCCCYLYQSIRESQRGKDIRVATMLLLFTSIYRKS